MNFFWNRVKELVNLQSYRVGNEDRAFYNMSWKKFKKIFIKRSQDILDKYSKRLINNWYYYQANLNNERGIKNYNISLNYENYFRRNKDFIITNIDAIVHSLCNDNTINPNDYDPSSLQYDGDVKIYVMPNRSIIMKWITISKGVKQYTRVPAYKKNPMEYEIKNDKPTFTFYVHSDKQYNAIYKGNSEERFVAVKKLILTDLKN